MEQDQEQREGQKKDEDTEKDEEQHGGKPDDKHNDKEEVQQKDKDQRKEQGKQQGRRQEQEQQDVLVATASHGAVEGCAGVEEREVWNFFLPLTYPVFLTRHSFSLLKPHHPAPMILSDCLIVRKNWNVGMHLNIRAVHCSESKSSPLRKKRRITLSKTNKRDDAATLKCKERSSVALYVLPCNIYTTGHVDWRAMLSTR